LNEHEKSVREILAETLHCIAVHDYPDEWPSLLPTLLNVIALNEDASQALRVHNALLALRKICKRYEYKSKEQRGPLNEIVVQTFPLLLPLAQRLSSPNENSLEAALMLKQILKIFWSSTQFYLPIGGPLSSPDAILPWFEVIRVILSKPLPEASTGLPPLNQPKDEAERNSWPWWKVKKWSVQIMSRLFSRYGMPAYAEEEVKDFAKFFSTQVAPQYLIPVLETLSLRSSGQFCTDRVVHLCLTYVDLAVELAPTYKVLKPHLDFLLYKVCFPTMCLTPSDVLLFENDPHEFVQRQNSPLMDFYDPRISSITLMTDLVKHRGKNVTQNLLGFLTDCLIRYESCSPEQKNPIEKDGALLAIGSLSDYLLSKKKYSSQMESLLVSHVFNEFHSPIGFLRCRACWIVQRYAKVNWSQDGNNLGTLIQLVLQRLSDPNLPVQIEASKALRFLIEVEGTEKTLFPVLPHILTEYFRIMNEIGNDEVVAALQVIIDKFGDHIEPHAVALVVQLSKSFSTYCSAGDDDDESALAAAQCLECIATVLKGTCERPDLYKSMEPCLIPLVKHILGNDGDYIEYLEYGLDIITFLTYFPDEIAPALWETFPMIYKAFDEWAFDYLSMMVPPLENFIGSSSSYFLVASTPEGTKYTDLIFSMVAKAVTQERTNESEIRKALSLYTTILQYCKGNVDAYVPLVNDVILVKLGQQLETESPHTRITIFQVIAAAIMYNPLLEILELEKRNVTHQVFSQWMLDSKKMEKWYSRKMTVLGLSYVLHCLTSSLPASLVNLIPQIIITVTNLSLNMHEESQKNPENKDVVEEEQEQDVDDDDDGGFAEDEDVFSQTNDSYVDVLNKLSGGSNDRDDLVKFLIGEDWDNDDDEDEDFASPIDDINELLFLNDTLKAAFEREPELYQQVQAALPPEALLNCQKLTKIADAQRAQPQSLLQNN